MGVAVATVAAAADPASAAAPAQWTELEMTVLVKAASKVYPPGTTGDRWAQIADYVHTHAHTAWTRAGKDVAATVAALKDIKATLGEKMAAGDSFQAMQAKQKDKSKTAAESVPTVRTDL
jgi:hypothetical protein